MAVKNIDLIVNCINQYNEISSELKKLKEYLNNKVEGCSITEYGDIELESKEVFDIIADYLKIEVEKTKLIRNGKPIYINYYIELPSEIQKGKRM